jgi:large subunit ribosomal protein L25
MKLNDFELSLHSRKRIGSGAARALRVDGRVPAILYGNGLNFCGHIDAKELQKAINTKTLFNKFTKINLDDKKHCIAYAKIIQKHPVSDKILHVDFQCVDINSIITISIPVYFINKELCEAIKLGGLLNIVARSIKLIGPVSAMPSCLEYDLTKATVGTAVKSEDLGVPNNVKIAIAFQSKVIATILAAKKKGDAAVAESATKAADK